MSERDKLEAMADRLEGVRGTIILHDMDQAAIIAHLDALIEPIRALAAQQPVEEPVVKPLFTAMGLPEVALPALMQAKELTGCMGGECKHASDCAVHNEPALPAGPCDCGLEPVPVAWMSPGKERLEFSRPDTVYGSHTIPLYTHPQASAPADHTAADATVREEGSGLKTAASTVGVTPDLDALVARVASVFVAYDGHGQEVKNVDDAAQAITDLRAQLAESKERAQNRLIGLCKCGIEREKQAARITRLEAENAEARELLKRAEDNVTNAELSDEITAFRAKGATP